MNCQYTCKKKKYDLKEIGGAQILLLNGDFIRLSKKEILKIEVSLYDKLIHFNNCYFPVAKSGFIKLKIVDRKPKYDNSSVYNLKEYTKDRKSFIEKICAEEGVFAIRLFDNLKWGDTIFGNILAKKENDFLILTFSESLSLGSADGENHVVNLKNVRKEDSRIIHLNFENCDGIDVYQDEIKEINLNFEKELEWNSKGYARVIKDGCIRLKFNKDYNDGRKANVCLKNNKLTLKDLEKRICGNGEDDVDICHLYVSNNYCGYGLEKEEAISLNNLSEYPKNYSEDDEEEIYIPYISGYAKKEKDGSILITFGKKGRNNVIYALQTQNYADRPFVRKKFN